MYATEPTRKLIQELGRDSFDLSQIFSWEKYVNIYHKMSRKPIVNWKMVIQFDNSSCRQIVFVTHVAKSDVNEE